MENPRRALLHSARALLPIFYFFLKHMFVSAPARVLSPVLEPLYGHFSIIYTFTHDMKGRYFREALAIYAVLVPLQLRRSFN